jgi:hypothetical protein
LNPRSAPSCERIAGKSVRTEGRFAEMGGRFGKTAAKPDLTFANIARIDAKALRSRSFVRIAMKSGRIDAKSAVTGTSGGRIDAICAAIDEISDTIVAMLGETRDGRMKADRRPVTDDR